MASHTQYRNLIVPNKTGAYKNIVISPAVATYNVNRGLLFEVSLLPGNTFAYILSGGDDQIMAVPAGSNIYITPEKTAPMAGDAAPMVLIPRKFYATKGKVNPILNIPMSDAQGAPSKETINCITAPCTDGSTGSEPQNNLEQAITSKFRKIGLGLLVAGWGVNAIIAYKFWNKSNFWKAGIIAVAGANSYYTYKYFIKK